MPLSSDLIQKVTTRGKELIIGGVGAADEFIRKQPVTAAVGVSGGILAGVTAVQIVRKARKKSTTTKKTTRKSTKSKPKSKSKCKSSKQKKPHTAGNGKDTSTRRIRFTKNNENKHSLIDFRVPLSWDFEKSNNLIG